MEGGGGKVSMYPISISLFLGFYPFACVSSVVVGVF